MQESVQEWPLKPILNLVGWGGKLRFLKVEEQERIRVYCCGKHLDSLRSRSLERGKNRSDYDKGVK